jgi:uncharacterized protein YjbI with pentapeptide repeats
MAGHRAGKQPEMASEDDMADQDVGWETCTDARCIGVRLPMGRKCWAHAADVDLDEALKRFSEHGQLDARGVPITQELLGRLLSAAPKDDQSHAVLTEARFDQATFQGDADFFGADFQGFAEFKRATFKRTTRFDQATFQGDARFYEASFQGIARFERVTFQGDAQFGEVTFQGIAHFSEAVFQRAAWFRASFERDAWFHKVTFQGLAGFDGATFQRLAWFTMATFQGITAFRVATFQDTAEFGGATFLQTRQFGPMVVHKSLQLEQAVFHERAHIEVAAAAVCCQRTRFLAGVQLRVRWAQVVLDDADLAAPSILAGAPVFQTLEEDRWVRALERLARLLGTDTRAGRPRLLSLRRADVAGLTVAGVDLRACRFAGAHHLDQLRVEESDFAPTPTGWRWSTRQTIAEEHHWRAAPTNGPDTASADTLVHGLGNAGSGAGWYCRAYQPPSWLDVEPLSPGQIAALYRALRKGREDNKDEPGAADFYYGEMEMRRHDLTKPTAERLVVFLYWLFSGYALRASRALAWLFGILAVASVLLAAVGLAAAGWSFPARLGTAALVAVEGAVFRASEQQLTYTGRLVQAFLRFAGPVLLGLAVLSIRGRVKR